MTVTSTAARVLGYLVFGGELMRFGQASMLLAVVVRAPRHLPEGRRVLSPYDDLDRTF